MKRAIARNVGTAALRGYRLAYNLISVVTLLPVLAIPALLPGDRLYQLSSPLLILTVSVQLFAILLLLIGLIQTGALEFLGIRQILAPSPGVESELVIRGLYRWVRHPLYFAGLLFIWFTPIMTTSFLALNIGLTAYIYIGSIFEERRLILQFGSQYEEYQRRVPRLFPRIWPSLRS